MSELRRYLRHFAPSWPALVVAAVLMSVAAAVPGAAVVLLERTLDLGLTDRPDLLPWLAAGFALLYLVSGAVRVARTRITKGIAWRVATELRCTLHQRYLALSPAQQRGTGARLASLTFEVDELQYGVSALVTAFRNPLTLAVLAVTAWSMAPSLAPWALLLVPAVAIPMVWGGRRLRRRATDAREARSTLAGLAQQQLAGLRTVQTFAAEDGEAARFSAAAGEDRRTRVRMEVERVLPSATVQLVAACAVALLLWAGGRQVLAGELDAGRLVGFAVALGLMGRPLGGLSEVWSLLQRSLASLERVYAALEAVPEVSAPLDPLPLPAGPHEVVWDQVTVDYGEGPVVRDLHLRVRAGELLALVGPSGAGKSTLLSLVGRHRDPEGGVVRVGEVDVRRLPLAALRRTVAVVPQEGFLFSRTIAENIALGRPDAPPADIEEAGRRAGADDFVRALPGGYDTALDELGQRLSGGERQRLCLARALLMEAPILLLDEATSQVDAETTHAFLEALERRAVGQTVVMVAHDLAAARSANRIAVLDGGRVVEQGTHAELVARGGRYAAMWRSGESVTRVAAEMP
jgi:ABC-type multidrug transport system fused ATPase/permease subunit